MLGDSVFAEARLRAYPAVKRSLAADRPETRDQRAQREEPRVKPKLAVAGSHALAGNSPPSGAAVASHRIASHRISVFQRRRRARASERASSRRSAAGDGWQMTRSGLRTPAVNAATFLGPLVSLGQPQSCFLPADRGHALDQASLPLGPCPALCMVPRRGRRQAIASFPPLSLSLSLPVVVLLCCSCRGVTRARTRRPPT